MGERAAVEVAAQHADGVVHRRGVAIRVTGPRKNRDQIDLPHLHAIDEASDLLVHGDGPAQCHQRAGCRRRAADNAYHQPLFRDDRASALPRMEGGVRLQVGKLIFVVLKNLRHNADGGGGGVIEGRVTRGHHLVALLNVFQFPQLQCCQVRAAADLQHCEVADLVPADDQGLLHLAIGEGHHHGCVRADHMFRGEHVAKGVENCARTEAARGFDLDDGRRCGV